MKFWKLFLYCSVFLYSTLSLHKSHISTSNVYIHSILYMQTKTLMYHDIELYIFYLEFESIVRIFLACWRELALVVQPSVNSCQTDVPSFGIVFSKRLFFFKKGGKWKYQRGFYMFLYVSMFFHGPKHVLEWPVLNKVIPTKPIEAKWQGICRFESLRSRHRVFFGSLSSFSLIFLLAAFNWTK